MTPIFLSNLQLLSQAKQDFSFLLDIGYVRNDFDDEINFVSDVFKFVLSSQRYGDSLEVRIYFIKNEKQLPSPFTLLQYCLENYSKEFSEISSSIESETHKLCPNAVGAKLLSEHSWIFTNTKWAYDVDFLQRVEMQKTWFEQQVSHGNIPSNKDCIEFLRESPLSGKTALARLRNLESQ